MGYSSNDNEHDSNALAEYEAFHRQEEEKRQKKVQLDTAESEAKSVKEEEKKIEEEKIEKKVPLDPTKIKEESVKKEKPPSEAGEKTNLEKRKAELEKETLEKIERLNAELEKREAELEKTTKEQEERSKRLEEAIKTQSEDKKRADLINSEEYQDFCKKVGVENPKSEEAILFFTVHKSSKEAVKGEIKNLTEKWDQEIPKSAVERVINRFYRKKLVVILILTSLIFNLLLVYLLLDTSSYIKQQYFGETLFKKEMKIEQEKGRYFLKLNANDKVSIGNKKSVWLERKSYFIDSKGNLFIYLGSEE